MEFKKLKIINRKGLVWGKIASWVIGLIVLALVIILILTLQKRGVSLLGQIKNFLRFGR